MSIDHQIAEKVIAAVRDSEGWQWVENKYGSNSWMAKGKLAVKAIKKIGPGDPWYYTHVYVDDVEWEIPSVLKKDIWEAAWPTFEKAEMRHREQLNAQILSKL
jgi:hypothetical protein